DYYCSTHAGSGTFIF
nr:immunoglobulin light chain junction region [Macaca mulatta]